MGLVVDRFRALLRRRDDQRNIAALAERLGLRESDAAWIYQRSRTVGFGAAMQEFEQRHRTPAAEGVER